MKLFRYRKPSLKTLLGYTGAKRQLKRKLGISQVQAWTKPSRVKQPAKYQLGWYSPVMRIARNTTKGKFPSFLGLLSRKRQPSGIMWQMGYAYAQPFVAMLNCKH